MFLISPGPKTENIHRFFQYFPVKDAERMQVQDSDAETFDQKSCTESPFAVLSDELVLNILSKLPDDPFPCSLVCKRWFRIHSLARRTIKLKDWNYLESGIMTARFPNLIDVDLTAACIARPERAAILLTSRFTSIWLSSAAYVPFPMEKVIFEQQILPSCFDDGLKILGYGCHGLQRLRLVDMRQFYDRGEENHNALSGHARHNDVRLNKVEHGLISISKNCHMLQELELLHCGDDSVDIMSAFQNLQKLRLVSYVDEVNNRSFTDIGLTKLAHNCKRLVKLELSGCEGSYDGIGAIGQCCSMLEELTLSDHEFFGGWIAALSFCSNLKTLKLENCKIVDSNPGPVERLGFCHALERLMLRQCNLREKDGFGALALACCSVKELEFKDCWGLHDDVFMLASHCRWVRYLSLEGCSLVSTAALESFLLGLKDLQSLRVVSCNSIRDSEITPSLASLFATLKELKWCPDTKSVLAVTLEGIGRIHTRGKILKRV